MLNFSIFIGFLNPFFISIFLTLMYFFIFLLGVDDTKGVMIHYFYISISYLVYIIFILFSRKVKLQVISTFMVVFNLYGLCFKYLFEFYYSFYSSWILMITIFSLSLVKLWVFIFLFFLKVRVALGLYFHKAYFFIPLLSISSFFVVIFYIYGLYFFVEISVASSYINAAMQMFNHLSAVLLLVLMSFVICEIRDYSK